MKPTLNLLNWRCALRLQKITSTRAKNYSTKAEKLITLKEKREFYGDLFPDKLLTKKHKTPTNLYVANEEVANLMDKSISPFLRYIPCDTAMEMNPGIGLFTQNLLKHRKFAKIILVENLDYFTPRLNELCVNNPTRVSLRHGDIVSSHRATFQDKMDNGNRIAKMMEDVPKKAINEDPNMVLFGAVGSYNFYVHLINSLVFQNGILGHGRCEMFLVVPPPIYIHLTCTKEVGYMCYRATTILFQILFEHRFIEYLPREHFLPTQTEFNFNKNSKQRKIRSVNREYLYLVKIVPRRNIAELCAIEDLPALWYFVKQNCVSRKNRVIPNLEKWIPGCGSRLIINRKSSVPVEQLYTDENLQKLPTFSKPCTTMSNCDFYPKMNIFTEFGDLTPSQMLTVFTQFRQWPEYCESPFLASYENTMLKMETAADENLDGVGIQEEDDVGGEEAVEELATVGKEAETTKDSHISKKKKT